MVAQSRMGTRVRENIGADQIAEQSRTGSYVPWEIPRERLTPVFGTGEPTSELPGTIRAAAYRLPATNALRWMLLLFSDRVDSGSNLLKELVIPGRQWLVVRHFVRQAQAEPLGVAWLVVTIVLLAWLFRRRPSRPVSGFDRLRRVIV